jgi:hypothetical protein
VHEHSKICHLNLNVCVVIERIFGPVSSQFDEREDTHNLILYRKGNDFTTNVTMTLKIYLCSNFYM